MQWSQYTIGLNASGLETSITVTTNTVKDNRLLQCFLRRGLHFLVAYNLKDNEIRIIHRGMRYPRLQKPFVGIH